MRILGLDIGTRTIGVALSDELGWTAQGIETIRFKEGQIHQSFEILEKHIKDYNVDKIVVGLPKHMNGSIGERGEACIAFGKEVEEKFQVPVVMWDERLSTMAAEKILIEADLSRKKRKKVIDKMAAVVILQGFLDSIK